MTCYLGDDELPEAIACTTDFIAIGEISARWTLGHRVPEDASVVGYDNIADGAFAVPPLTTIDFYKPAYASKVLDLLEKPDRGSRLGRSSASRCPTGCWSAGAAWLRGADVLCRPTIGCAIRRDAFVTCR